MIVKRIIGGPLETNCYVVNLEGSPNCYVIDPGYGPDAYADYISENGLNPMGIILTHLHDDHTGGAEKLASILNCRIFMSEIESKYYSGRVDKYLYEGDRISFNVEGKESSDFEVVNTPGHTKGGICLISKGENLVFTGDTLFDIDLGRSDLAGGSEDDMISSIRNKISKWPDAYYVYPGHDTGATMAMVRKYNKEYIAIMEGRSRL